MPEIQPLPPQDPMLSMVLERKRLSRRQTMVGIGGTVLLHLLGWLMIPDNLFVPEATEPVNKFRDFSIELAQPEEEPEMVYTQTNPDVPENEPDETNRFAARDQQAANPDVPDELDPEERPASESEDTIETDQFLSGSLDEPVFAPPPRESEQQEEPVEPQEPAQQQPLLQVVEPSEAPPKQEIPIMGSQEDADPDESGIADFDYDKLEEAPTNITDFIEGAEEEGEEGREEALEQMAVSAPVSPAVQAVDTLPSPRPRPQLPRVPPGPTRNSRLGVTALGEVATDAKASKFGEYMERLIETVSIAWDDLATKSSHIESNRMVKIKFTLTKEGYVSDMEILDGTTARAIGIYMCREAIQKGVPFGPWPSGLVEMFGDDEDITFSFHYR